MPTLFDNTTYRNAQLYLFMKFYLIFTSISYSLGYYLYQRHPSNKQLFMWGFYLLILVEIFLFYYYYEKIGEKYLLLNTKEKSVQYEYSTKPIHGIKKLILTRRSFTIFNEPPKKENFWDIIKSQIQGIGIMNNILKNYYFEWNIIVSTEDKEFEIFMIESNDSSQFYKTLLKMCLYLADNLSSELVVDDNYNKIIYKKNKIVAHEAKQSQLFAKEVISSNEIKRRRVEIIHKMVGNKRILSVKISVSIKSIFKKIFTLFFILLLLVINLLAYINNLNSELFSNPIFLEFSNLQVVIFFVTFLWFLIINEISNYHIKLVYDTKKYIFSLQKFSMFRKKKKLIPLKEFIDIRIVVVTPFYTFLEITTSKEKILLFNKHLSLEDSNLIYSALLEILDLEKLEKTNSEYLWNKK